MKRPAAWVAFGGGAGLSPWAPGTCGTALAVPLWCALVFLPWPVYTALLVVLFAVGVRTADAMITRLGRKDPGAVVFDEMVGYWITMATVPEWNGAALIAGFILFRVFDIFKPWPVGHLDERLPGGLGVMADDAMAGLYGAGILAAAWHGSALFG